MRFPNALEGVKKIYKAEIIGLIGVIIGLVASILTLAGVGAGEGGLGLAAVGGILLIAMAVLLVISFIMNIVGLNKAKPDEENFKYALYMVLIGIILSIVVGATKEGTLIHTLGESISKICNLLVNYLVATALMNLAEKLGDTAVAQKAKSVRTLLTIVWVIALVLQVLGDAFTSKAGIIAFVLTLIASIIEIIAYIVYLSLLSKARGMLEA